MIRFLLAVFFISFIHVSGNVLSKISQSSLDWINFGKIAGENSEISEAPYQVAMLYSKPGGNYFQACGGSIISPNVIVSAGHCPHNTIATDWKVRAGSTQSDSGGQLLDVTRTIIHPNYNGSTIDYDISLFILASDINIDGINTKIIPLPEQDVFIADNTEALVTGWGSTREGGNPVRNLRKVKIPIVNQKVCTDVYAGSSIVTPRMICAGILKTGGKDACHGDSGGPLVVDGVLIGITSWGRGCARDGYVGVWTRVPALRNWIDSNIP